MWLSGRESVRVVLVIPTRAESSLILIGKSMTTTTRVQTAFFKGSNGTNISTGGYGVVISHWLLLLSRDVRNTGICQVLLAVVHTLGLELLTGLAAATAGSAAGADLENESEQRERRANPHEDQHLGADVGFDLDVRVGV